MLIFWICVNYTELSGSESYPNLTVFFISSFLLRPLLRLFVRIRRSVVLTGLHESQSSPSNLSHLLGRCSERTIFLKRLRRQRPALSWSECITPHLPWMAGMADLLCPRRHLYLHISTTPSLPPSMFAIRRFHCSFPYSSIFLSTRCQGWLLVGHFQGTMFY